MDNPSTCENLYILGVPISHSFPTYLIHKNSKMYTLFTCKQNYFSRPQPGLLRTHGLEGASSSRVPERVVPRLGEQCPVERFSTRVTPYLKCTCNGVHKRQSHFIQFMQHYMKCSMSCMRCDPSFSQPES